jgi:hypothetical protein
MLKYLTIFKTMKKIQIIFLLSILLQSCFQSKEGVDKACDSAKQDSIECAERLKAIREELKAKGPLKFPVLAVCIGDGAEEFEKSYQYVCENKILVGHGILGVLPDTSSHFGVIVIQPTDISEPYLLAVDKTGMVSSYSGLFSWDGWDHSMYLDSTIYMTEYTLINKDLSFSKVLESKSLEHVWKEEGGPIMNDAKDAIPDTALLRHFKDVVKGSINKDYTINVDWEVADTLENKTVGLRYNWEEKPALNIDSLLQKSKNEPLSNFERFNRIYEKSPHCGFPFHLKGNDTNIETLPLDTSAMKDFFGIKDFMYDVYDFNQDTEVRSYRSSHIMDVWINTSWMHGNNRCFVLESWKEGSADSEGESLTHFCVVSDKGTLIDKLTINEGGEEEGKYRAYIVVDENTIMTFCYEINWSYENKIRANVNVENESPTIVHINEYKITEEGQFKLSNQIEVFVREVNGNYISNHLKLPDDPFYEYLKKTE